MPSLTARRSLLAAAAIGASCGALAAIAAAPVATSAPSSEPKVKKIVRGSGDIGPTVRRFRALLGPDNGGAPGGKANGRRELNWDGVPDGFASPNAFPSAFFNARTAPRARGAVLTTPGAGLRVSADADNPDGAPALFADINPTYAGEFATFSPERLFSPVGSNVANLTFRVPGTRRRAVVRGFGAVYTGIDRRENTAFEYFDRAGDSLGRFAVPVGRDRLSFLGVVFTRAVIARVRIEYGSGPLGPDDGAAVDAAVMDDFIYGEPVALR
jgi:hypothetical protein